MAYSGKSAGKGKGKALGRGKHETVQQVSWLSNGTLGTWLNDQVQKAKVAWGVVVAAAGLLGYNWNNVKVPFPDFKAPPAIVAPADSAK